MKPKQIQKKTHKDTIHSKFWDGLFLYKEDTLLGLIGRLEEWLIFSQARKLSVSCRFPSPSTATLQCNSFVCLGTNF